MKTKLLIDGCWVNVGSVDEPKWAMMVYPVVSKIRSCNNVVGAMILCGMDKISTPGEHCDLLFNRIVDTTATLMHLGDFSCQEGYEWQLLLLIPIPPILENTVSTQSKKGFMFLEDIKPKDTEDDLDMWIYERLSSLTAPKIIHF